MKIYTSYYAKLRYINTEKYCPIRVSKSKPAWLDGVLIKGIPAVYPPWDLINDWKNDEITWETYTDIYLYQLSFINNEDVISKICEISNGKDAVLLCHEDNTKKCHRHILADWLDCNVKELIV